MQPRQMIREIAVGEMTALEIVGGQHGEDVGSVHEGIFHGLTHARFYFLDKHAQGQERCQPDDQEEAEEDAQADMHGMPLSSLS